MNSEPCILACKRRALSGIDIESAEGRSEKYLMMGQVAVDA